MKSHLRSINWLRLAFPFGLVLVITIAVGYSYDKLFPSSWTTPTSYFWDSMWNLAAAKAYQSGEIVPHLAKSVETLNAPFAGDWSDYPNSDDFTFAFMGYLARLIGLFPAANALLWLAHVLAGLSFFSVARSLGSKEPWAFAGGFIFAISPYAFTRGFFHIVLTLYWLLPWCYWVYRKMTDNREPDVGVRHVLIALASGFQFPYYTFMALQLWGLALLQALARGRRKRAITIGGLIALTLFAFLITQLDTIWYRYANGPNPNAAIRELSDLEYYGMKISEFFFPGQHRWSAWLKFAHKTLFGRLIMSPPEIRGSTYLGFVGIGAFFSLFGVSLWRILKQRASRVPTEFWLMTWVLAYSVIGGINHLAGAFGLMAFRCSNRYAIVVLMLCLFYLVREGSRLIRGPMSYVACVGLCGLAAWDTLPDPDLSLNKRSEVERSIQSDRDFAAKLERALPKGAMVFMLPEADFPESSGQNRMWDYEHFRPYLYTSSIRYSYGTNKGRVREAWQKQIAGLPLSNMVLALETYGFRALYLNLRGLANGPELVAQIKELRLQEIGRSLDGDLLAFALNPSQTPREPGMVIWLDKGWNQQQGPLLWAKGATANLQLWSPQSTDDFGLEFGLVCENSCDVEIFLNGSSVSKISTTPGQAARTSQLPLNLRKGANTIRFESDLTEPSPLSNGVVNTFGLRTPALVPRAK